MSIFEKLSAAMGMGGMRVSVTGSDAPLYRGRPVSAIVTLEGGSVGQRMLKLTVDLVEFWVQGSGRNRTYHTAVREQQELQGETVVIPGFARTFAVNVAVPPDARCSRAREGWQLSVEAHIPMAVDARATAELKVLPHPEVLAVQRAMKGPVGMIPISWDGAGPVVVYDFGAPEWLRPVLDGVAVHLSVEGDLLVGELVVNRQEHSLADVLRAAVHADRESIPFSIPREQLLTQRGSPNPNGALPYMKKLFAQIGVVMPETPTGGASLP